METFVSIGTACDEAKIQRLGFAILRETLRLAAYPYLHATTPTYRAVEIQQATAFVQGSGIHVVIRNFGGNIDPDIFTEMFWRTCHRLQRAQSSFVTTVAATS